MQEKITDIRVNKVYDSHGQETIKVILTGQNYTGSYTVPNLKSSSNVVLPPEEAMNRIMTIVKPEIIGLSCYDQKLIDEKLIEIDNTPNYSHLGINSIAGVSISAARLSSHEGKDILAQYLGGINSQVFPIPLVGVMTDRHSNRANGIAEIFLIPLNFISFKASLEAVYRVNRLIEENLSENLSAIDFDGDGLLISPFKTTAEALEFLTDAIERAGFNPGLDIAFGLDVSADQFFSETENIYALDNMKLQTAELIDYYDDLSNYYPLLIIEDPLSSRDGDGWHEMMKRFSYRLFIVGDKIFHGSYNKIKEGYTHQLINSVAFNSGMFGTLSNFNTNLNYAKIQGLISIYKTYDGETEDTFDSDLCLGSSIPFFQAGPLKRAEKTGKYNRLLDLSDIMKNSEYAYKYLADRNIFRNFLQKFRQNVD